MKLRSTILVLALLLMGFGTSAYVHSQEINYEDVSSHIPNDMLTSKGVPINSLFMPFAFKSEVLHSTPKSPSVSEGLFADSCLLRLESADKTLEWFSILGQRDSLRSRAQVYAAVSNPYTVRYLMNRIADKKAIEERMEREAVAQKKIPSLFQSEELRLPPTVAEMKGVKAKKLSMWQSNSVANLQFTQNYISSNWHQGGESNISLLSSFNWKFTYRDEKNIQFDNELDWRAGFFSAPSDSLRTFRVNDDQLRLTSKFGYKAFQKWYYTASMEIKTKLFNSYSPNTTTMQSTFLTPVEGYFSLGLDFKTKYEKPRIHELSLFFAPLTYSFKYAARSHMVDVTRYGIEEGKSSLSTIGSMFRGVMKYEIIKNITWDTRVYYFSNYSNVEAEWENSFNLSINRYFSTRVFFIVRYDDRVSKGVDDSFFQFKEFLSFGFTYKW
ncbi:MAG: DUF3078 domain-containing protein [Bacteroidales bacterium]